MSATAPAGRVDFADPDFLADPWSAYHWHRCHAPVWWSDRLNTYFVFGYDLVRHVLVADDFTVFHPFRRSRPAFGPSVLDQDGATHARLRGAIAPLARRRVAAGYTAAFIRPMADELIGAMIADRRADLAEALAARLPLRVVCQILGLPEHELDLIDGLLRPLLRYIDHGPVLVADVLRHRRKLEAYLLDRLSGDPHRDGLLHQLAANDALDESEVLSSAIQFLAGATENTAAMMVNLLARVAEDPSLFALIRRDPSVIPAVVTETIRHQPSQHVTTRYAVADTELGGVTIPGGTPVQACLASANRDPAVYPDPDVWDLRRERTVPLSFGTGRHHCIGMGLASAELETVLAVLAERVTDLTVIAPRPPLPSGRTFRFVEHLRLDFTAAPVRSAQ